MHSTNSSFRTSIKNLLLINLVFLFFIMFFVVLFLVFKYWDLGQLAFPVSGIVFKLRIINIKQNTLDWGRATREDSAHNGDIMQKISKNFTLLFKRHTSIVPAVEGSHLVRAAHGHMIFIFCMRHCRLKKE
jgi:hypothetical protein